MSLFKSINIQESIIEETDYVDVDLTFEYEDERTGNTAEMAIPIGVGFFWPDADV